MPPIELSQSTHGYTSAATVLEMAIPGNRDLERAPRFLLVRRSGSFQFEDWEGNVDWMFARAGTVIPFSPRKILRTNGAVLFCAY